MVGEPVRGPAGPSLGNLTPVDPGRSDANEPSGIHILSEEAAAVLEQARASRHGKGTHVLWMGPHQRLVLIGLIEGAGLGVHSSPPAASFQVLAGTARLYAAEPGPDGTIPEWVVGAGQIAAIPPERHGVDAVTDCVILLTVSLDPHAPRA